MAEWETREVCMAIKAYPNPVHDLGEAVCTAGVDRAGAWVRVYPVLFRDLPLDKRFSKYQWIRARFKKSNDPRPESYEVDTTASSAWRRSIRRTEPGGRRGRRSSLRTSWRASRSCS